jgi:CheY-like chemotaxis protein
MLMQEMDRTVLVAPSSNSMRAKQPVLFVDDNEDDTFLVRRAWQRLDIDHPLQTVTTLQQARDYLEGKAAFGSAQDLQLPCIVITDLRLQDDEGFALLEWIRSHEKLKTLIVVVLTAHLYPGDMNRAYRLGANSFLSKPTDAVKFGELVRLIGDYWLKANHNPPECAEPPPTAGP